MPSFHGWCCIYCKFKRTRALNLVPNEPRFRKQVHDEYIKFNSRNSSHCNRRENMPWNHWNLGCDWLEEVNDYKCLWYLISRTHRPHIFLKEKFDRHINQLIRILGEHEDLNRILLSVKTTLINMRIQFPYLCLNPSEICLKVGRIG